MNTGIVLRLPAGDQVDLECAFKDFIENLNIRTTDPEEAQAWGECRVLQGTILHGIQWSVNEDGDCEVDCSWHEEENYVEQS